MTLAQPTIPRMFSCLLSRDPETGRWNGHCLDFDIATSGTDEESAWQNLKLIVRHHVEECFESWPDGLTNRTASQERWAQFRSLENSKKPFRQDKIHLNLVVPNEDDMDMWIRALEFPKVADCGQAQSVNM